MRRAYKSALLRSACKLTFAIAAISLLMVDAANAAPPGSCPTSITACGCVVTKPNTYLVQNDLSASDTSQPICIEISASDSILNLQGNAVIGSGNGSGIGILIDKNATHVLVEGGIEGSTAPADDAGIDGMEFPNAQAVVTQWNVGIEDDGDNAVIALFKNIGGNIFQQTFGNTTAGIFFNGAKGSVAVDFLASYNGADGVMLKNSSGIRMSNFSTISNTTAGVLLDGSTDNSIGTASASSNGKYGFWLLGSSRNLISNCNGTSGNGDTGILLGCGTVKCGGAKSDDNRITNSGAPGNTNNGIVIEKNDKDNIVTVTHNDGNPDQHDMVDLNPHCSTNIWYNNTGSASQSCIH